MIPRRTEKCFTLSWLAAAFFLASITFLCPVVQCFHLHRTGQRQPQRSQCLHSPWSGYSLKAIKANGDSSHAGGDMPSDGNDDAEETSNLLGQASAASRLSHAMLQVPSVDATVNYWKETAKAQVTASSKVNDKEDDGDLRSAFVVLGNGKSIDQCFALELVQNKHKKDDFQLGNAVSYIGVSKLIQYASKEDLIALITGTTPQGPTADEPNGIRVTSCASAPGDFFARFSLHATNLETTTEFYTNILGMKVAAVGDNGEMLCLRYPSPPKQDKANDNDDDNDASSSSAYGVSTTLVFEPLSAESTLEKGNCFDHLVIATQADIEAVYDQLQILLEASDLNCPIFMKPTEMFGQKVIGVMDPDGFKVILAGKS